MLLRQSFKNDCNHFYLLSLSCYKNQIHCISNSYQNHVYKLDPIIIGGNANLFYSHKDIKTFFHIANRELVKVNHWFKANKLSLNVKKRRNTAFFTNLQLKRIYF